MSMGSHVVAEAAPKKQGTHPSAGGVLQRKCSRRGKRAEERKKGALQRAAIGPVPEAVPPVVQDVLRSPGQPLDRETREFMEPRFGHDFSQVRVHTDARAAESARTINALAYTVGHNVVFGSGHYRPGTMEGRRVLAHELTHTIQQGSAPPFVQRLNAGGGGNGRRIASAGRGSAGRSASRVAEDDGVGPAEARRALEAHVDRRILDIIEGRAVSSESEEEAERVAGRVAGGSSAAGTIQRMQSPSIQMIHPGLIVLGVAAAVVLCALGFYHYAMDHYARRGDSWLHCYTSCKIANYCGGFTPGVGQAVSILAGLGKEAVDYICDVLGGPCGAEWEDFVADMEGVVCSFQFWRSCVSCCDEVSP